MKHDIVFYTCLHYSAMLNVLLFWWNQHPVFKFKKQLLYHHRRQKLKSLQIWVWSSSNESSNNASGDASFALVHLHKSLSRRLNRKFLLKFAFYAARLFLPDPVSTIAISPSYFAVMQLVKVSKISPIFRGRAKIIFKSLSSAESTFQNLWFMVVWSPWIALDVFDSL